MTRMDDIVLVRDLPPELGESVGRGLAAFTIGFLRLQAAGENGPAELLGSGVLVVVEDTRAILTAHHVLQVLPRTGRLGLFLGQTNTPHTIDTQGIAFLDIARGRQDSVGPDLGALILSPSIGSAIAAKKSFYNLTARRDMLLHSPPDLGDGVWFANGFLAERGAVTREPDGSHATKWFYNFSAIGGPEPSPDVGSHDYFEFPVSHESRTEVPASWGGMSGGGLWQVPLRRQDGTTLPGSLLLSGILFYQQPTTPTQCGVRAHGRKSLYEVAYDSMRRRALTRG